jgi:RND superfamily putative drug exporter
LDSYTSEDNQSEETFFLPKGALEAYPKLKSAMDLFISPNGKGVILDVILTTPPYTNESLNKVKEIRDEIKASLRGTYLKDAEYHVGGATATFSEVRDMTAQDFIVVMLFVLIGIFIVLSILLRSVIAPAYLILTILLSYGTTMGITYLVFQVGLGNEGLSWPVPFFAFCLLVALGVDYNIFLMSRVKEEYRPNDVTGSVKRALSSTGGIITSCGIIMAGTFGALTLSPINSLMEVGFATVVGLLLDTFIVRTLLVPAIAVKVGELNWWPGKKVKIVSCSEEKE